MDEWLNKEEQKKYKEREIKRVKRGREYNQYSTHTIIKRRCPLCDRPAKLTDALIDHEWIKVCPACMYSSL